MVLFARSDMMSVSIPATSGGCGATHTRPVTHGNPAKIWKLECDKGCESYLRGDKKPRVIHVFPGDKDKGIPGRTEHVADCDPHWSTTPEGIPLTPDEQNIHRIRADQGQRQLDRLTAFAALKQSGMKIPPQAQWLIDSTLDEIAQLERVNEPAVSSALCTDGHDNLPGAKFCSECGMSMKPPPEDLQDAIARLAEDPKFKGKVTVLPPARKAPSLDSAHVNTLKKMARDKGLNDKGTKAQIIERLTAIKVS